MTYEIDAISGEIFIQGKEKINYKIPDINWINGKTKEDVIIFLNKFEKESQLELLKIIISYLKCYIKEDIEKNKNEKLLKELNEHPTYILRLFFDKRGIK